MAKRPVELVLESTLLEIEGRRVMRDDFLESWRRLQKSMLRGTLAYSTRQYPMLAVSEVLLSVALSIPEVTHSFGRIVGDFWHRFLFGADYDRPYRKYEGGSFRIPSGHENIFTPEVVAALEEKELLLETGRGLGVRSASALFREGI
jgi:hypothetical protein